MSTTRTALVTGGSRGIGRGIALALAEAGFDVAVNYVNNLDAAREVQNLVEDRGRTAHLLQGDISLQEDRHRLVTETYERFERLDLLVNNAGISPRSRDDLLDLSADDFDHMIEVNLKGPFFLTQQIARRMLSQGNPPERAPKIVVISSISAYTASVNRGAYCLAKAGLGMMVSLYAARLAEHGINVYEIRPGIIATDMTRGVTSRYDRLIFEEGLTPIRRWGQPLDVGKAVVAVGTDLLPFSTGAVLDVDGGFHLRRL